MRWRVRFECLDCFRRWWDSRPVGDQLRARCDDCDGTRVHRTIESLAESSQ